MTESADDHAARVLREVLETTAQLDALVDAAQADDHEQAEALETAPIRHYSEQLSTMIARLREETAEVGVAARPRFEDAAAAAQAAVDRARTL